MHTVMKQPWGAGVVALIQDFTWTKIIAPLHWNMTFQTSISNLNCEIHIMQWCKIINKRSGKHICLRFEVQIFSLLSPLCYTRKNPIYWILNLQSFEFPHVNEKRSLCKYGPHLCSVKSSTDLLYCSILYHKCSLKSLPFDIWIFLVNLFRPALF